jgi:glycosyltransferase involved in cell wall biosynthesis
MRILLVNHTARAHTGGLNRIVVETCGLLVSARHSVALAFNDGGASEVACPTFALPADDAPDAAMRAAFEDVLQKFQPEVVQLHGADHAFFRTEIARRVPTCRFIHDQSLFCSGGDRMSGDFAPCHRAHGTACLALHYATRCGGKNPFGNWERWRRVQRRCEMKNEPRLRLQVASEFMRRGLLENGYDAERIDVVPLFAIPPNTPPQTEPDLLLVASRLVKAKGVHLLLRALATIADAPWRLVVAGTGPEFSALQNLAHELALRERVRFTGELTPRELDAWYARAAIVVSPVLRPEPFGLVGIRAGKVCGTARVVVREVRGRISAMMKLIPADHRVRAAADFDFAS